MDVPSLRSLGITFYKCFFTDQIPGFSSILVIKAVGHFCLPIRRSMDVTYV